MVAVVSSSAASPLRRMQFAAGRARRSCRRPGQTSPPVRSRERSARRVRQCEGTVAWPAGHPADGGFSMSQARARRRHRYVGVSADRRHRSAHRVLVVRRRQQRESRRGPRPRLRATPFAANSVRRRGRRVADPASRLGGGGGAPVCSGADVLRTWRGTRHHVLTWHAPSDIVSLNMHSGMLTTALTDGSGRGSPDPAFQPLRSVSYAQPGARAPDGDRRWRCDRGGRRDSPERGLSSQAPLRRSRGARLLGYSDGRSCTHPVARSTSTGTSEQDVLARTCGPAGRSGRRPRRHRLDDPARFCWSVFSYLRGEPIRSPPRAFARAAPSRPPDRSSATLDARTTASTRRRRVRPPPAPDVRHRCSPSTVSAEPDRRQDRLRLVAGQAGLGHRR